MLVRGARSLMTGKKARLPSPTDPRTTKVCYDEKVFSFTEEKTKAAAGQRFCLFMEDLAAGEILDT